MKASLIAALAALTVTATAQLHYPQLKNPSFELGKTNWIFGTYAFTQSAHVYSGTNAVAIGAVSGLSQRQVPITLGVTNCVTYHATAIHGASERTAILQASQPGPGTNRAEIRLKVSNQGWHPLTVKFCWTNGPAKVDIFLRGDCVAIDQ